MSFGTPHWFWALALLPALLALFFWNEQRRAILLQKLVATRLMQDLAASVSAGKRRFRFFMLLIGLTCVIVALARPQFGYTWQQTKRKGRDVIIAIDTSKSMLSTDLAPNRLTRAKLAAQDLINQLPGDRVGLIAFAGDAFLQAPLTIDYSAVLSSIDELDTNIIPRGGTDIASAIRIAAEAFGKGESENRALILMTDGEELDEDAVKGAREHANDFRIYTIGVGSHEGSLIPVQDEQGGTTFVKDNSGQIVKSKLDENRLTEIAEAAGGFYLPLENGPVTMKQIVQQGLEPMGEHDIDTRTSRQPIERYQWPLAAGIALLAWSLLIGERRRVRAAVAALFLILPLSAFSANTGVELYNKQDYKQSLDIFQKQLARNPKSEALQFDAGAAAYKLGDYDKALEDFSKALTARDPATHEMAEYNIGNTLFQRGAKQQEKEPKLREWQNALQHYDEALKVDPKNDNAKTNREIVRKLIEELQKEPPKQEQQKQDQQKNQQDQKDQQQKSEQNQQQQPQSEQQKNSRQQQPQPNKDQQKDQQDQQQQNSQNQQNKSADKNQRPEQKPSDSARNEKDQTAQNSQQNPQAGNSPAAAPTPREEKLSGEIKPQNSDQKPSEQQQAEAVPVRPGEMSEQQAHALIDSLRNEDTRVQLNERQRTEPVLKDW